jgi:uncharacterized protein (UPF0332 family)
VTDEVRKYLEKADHALRVAEDLARIGHVSDATSKVYYAMFYAAQALLRSEEIDVIRHASVESAFGFYFAKTGKIDPRYHRMLIRARTAREIADYDLQEEEDSQTAQSRIADGKEFVAAIKALLGCH